VRLFADFSLVNTLHLSSTSSFSSLSSKHSAQPLLWVTFTFCLAGGVPAKGFFFLVPILPKSDFDATASGGTQDIENKKLQISLAVWSYKGKWEYPVFFPNNTLGYTWLGMLIAVQGPDQNRYYQTPL
jgi:hypothetical protein